jgi:S-adenosylmethionine:tRNA ribosyltransferase-isomerase
VIAVGTTVVRALESAAADAGVRPGSGIARIRIGPRTRLRVVDAILTGVHKPGESHFELLRAFVGDARLVEIGRALERDGYRTHEFGDSLLLEREPPPPSRREFPKAGPAPAFTLP